MCLTGALAQKKADIVSGYYVNNDAEFYFDKNGTFTYYDFSVYRSDVYIIFCNEWTRGNWKIKDEFIEISSNMLEKPILFDISETDSNDSVNNISVALKDTLFKNDYKIILINNKNKDSIEVGLNQKVSNVTKGEYFLKLLPNKQNVQERMNLNNESFTSKTFILNEQKSYSIQVDFDKNIFAYQTFKDVKIKLKRNKIIFDKWSFKKMKENYNSKISSFY